MTNTNTKILFITAGIGVAFMGGFIWVQRMLSRQRRTAWKRIFQNDHSWERLQRKVHVINTVNDWEALYPLLKKDIQKVQMLGFDCEWVANKPSEATKVALLQLASHEGLCALVRLCKMQTIPPSLQSILTDSSILKVGVASCEDGWKITQSYGVNVNGCVDVRHIVLQHPDADVHKKQMGLAGLSDRILGLKLEKDWRIACSNWEAETLSHKQIQYAALDAIVSLHVTLLLGSETFVPTSVFHLFSRPTMHQTASLIVENVEGLRDIPFKNKVKINPATPSGNGKGKVTNPLKNTSRAYSARKSPMYENCYLQAPDGQPLCTCDRKKAYWYVTKGIGSVVEEDPLTVRLHFEPAGRPKHECDQYYVMRKDNACVVCGRADSYIRKNIVPHEYRKHFPTYMKDHKSHDILLLCFHCHQQSNIHDLSLRQALALKCDAPIGVHNDVKVREDADLKSVRSAARALLKDGNNLPHFRKEELRAVLKAHFDREITSELLVEAANIEIRIFNEDYIPHGLKVVEHYSAIDQGLFELEKLWRQHFLLTMKPKFLPALWSPDHYKEKLEERKNAQQS